MNVLGINLTETYVGKRFRNTTDLLSGISGSKALKFSPLAIYTKSKPVAESCRMYGLLVDNRR